jgi:hypothetical protein
MLLRPGAIPSGDGSAFELKYDRFRVTGSPPMTGRHAFGLVGARGGWPNTMGESEARLVKNEALFREVNEQIDSLNDAGAQVESLPIVCECGSASCSEVISVDRDVYEAVRAHSERFLVAPGHEIDAVEDVVEQTETFMVVAKKPGGPRRLAEETDPRQ